MLAIRQILEDPQDVIPIPPELRHRRTEVIFIALDPEPTREDLGGLLGKAPSLTPKALGSPRADWFKGYTPETDVDVWEALPVDEGAEEWQW